MCCLSDGGKVGRVTPCAPFGAAILLSSAHGVQLQIIFFPSTLGALNLELFSIEFSRFSVPDSSEVPRRFGAGRRRNLVRVRCRHSSGQERRASTGESCIARGDQAKGSVVFSFSQPAACVRVAEL